MSFTVFVRKKTHGPGVTRENSNSSIKFEFFQVSYSELGELCVVKCFQMGLASHCGSKFSDFVEIHFRASGSPWRCLGRVSGLLGWLLQRSDVLIFHKDDFDMGMLLAAQVANRFSAVSAGPKLDVSWTRPPWVLPSPKYGSA